MRVVGSTGVELMDFWLDSPGSTVRDGAPASAGLVVSASRLVEVSRGSITRSAQAGVFVDRSALVRISDREIRDTRAAGVAVPASTRGTFNGGPCPRPNAGVTSDSRGRHGQLGTTDSGQPEDYAVKS